ncbi:MAG: hypothetical protein NVS2B5_10850 [Beijerinckiaceae bacterium]
MQGRIFIERSVGADLIVVISIRAQDAAQMLLAEDNDVVQAFAANGPDQSFGKTVLPG